MYPPNTMSQEESKTPKTPTDGRRIDSESSKTEVDNTPVSLNEAQHGAPQSNTSEIGQLSARLDAELSTDDPIIESESSKSSKTCVGALITAVRREIGERQSDDPNHILGPLQKILPKIENAEVPLNEKGIDNALKKEGINDVDMRRILVEEFYTSVIPPIVHANSKYAIKYLHKVDGLHPTDSSAEHQFLFGSGDYDETVLAKLPQRTKELIKVARSKRNSRPLEGKELLQAFQDINDVLSLTLTPKKKLYDTPSHMYILSKLGKMSYSLLTGKFNESNGEQSKVFIGPKGVGKTSTLKTFTELAQYVYGKRLMPLYVSYQGIHTGSEQLPCSRNLGDIISSLVGDVEPPKVDYLEVPDKLFTKELYFFVLVDELDILYTAEPGTSTGRILNESLGALDFLSTEGFGKSMAVCVTGSSTYIPLLINKDAVKYENLRMKFPLVTISPNLNTTKYQSLLVDVCKPTDIEITARVLGKNIEVEEDKQLCTVITFLMGNNPRTLRDRINSTLDKGTVDSGILDALLDNAAEHNASLVLCCQNRNFYAEMLGLFYTCNEGFFINAKGDDSTLSMDKIDPLETFKPVSVGYAQKECSSFTLDDLRDFTDDGCCIAQREGAATLLWPSSIYLVHAFKELQGAVRNPSRDLAMLLWKY